MKLQRIHQIEITSECNLRCRYCVHPKMTRPKQHMDMDTFMHTLNLTEYLFLMNGPQAEINIAGIGESFMHPDLVEYASIIRYTLGPHIKILLATNGVSVTEEVVKELAKVNVRVYVSLHRPEKAGPAIEILKKYSLLDGVSADPSIAAVNWAGQVDWIVSCDTTKVCPWIRDSMAMITSTGDIVQCCFDGNGRSVLGSVFDDKEDIYDIETRPYELCRDCHLLTPKHGNWVEHTRMAIANG